MASYEGPKLIKVSAENEGYVNGIDESVPPFLAERKVAFIFHRVGSDRYRILLASNPQLGLTRTENLFLIQLTNEPSEFVVVPAREAKPLGGADAVYIRPIDYEDNDFYLSISPMLHFPPKLGFVPKDLSKEQFFYLVKDN
ncbi:hypothetical protein ACQY0O_007210 [Thecaphora frezii]